MAETKEQAAMKIFSSLRDEICEAFQKIPDLPRFMSRLYVKKVLSGPGKNAAMVCDLMGRGFQVSFLLNMIETEIKENYKCLLALVRILEKDLKMFGLGANIKSACRIYLPGASQEVDIGADSEPDSSLSADEEVTKSKVHLAALHGYLRTVKKYIEEKGTDPWVRDENGNSLLHYAAISGSIDLMEYLVKEHYCSPTSMGESGQTPLHLAAQFNHLDVVKYLTEELEADPNFPDEDGNTPLHIAARSNAVNSAEFLIVNKKCDPMCKNYDGLTTIHMAAMAGSPEFLQFMMEDLALSLDLTIKNNEGMTPLHLACQFGVGATVMYLVSHGSDPEVKDGYMRTSLHYASQAGKLDVVMYLVVEQGCDGKYKDQDGHTPLDLANNFQVKEFFKTHQSLPI